MAVGWALAMMGFTPLALYVTVLGWMTSLAPGRDHAVLAWSISTLSSSLSEAALVTAIAYRESGFDNAAVGDHGRSFCAMQIHRSSGGRLELTEDPEACVSRAIAILRQSIKIDRLHPVAFYARGPRYESVQAQRISNDRVALAKRLLAQD